MKKLHLVLAGACVVLAIAPWLIWWSSLPAQMASHWSLGDRPNDHLSKALLFVLLGGLATALAVGSVGAMHQGSALPRPASSAPGLTFGAGVVAVLSLAVVIANRDVRSWQEARLPFGWLVGAFGVGGLLAVVAAAGLPRSREVAARPSHAIAVGRNESVAWVGHARARWAIVLATGLIVLGVFLLLGAQPVGGAVMIVSAVVVALFSSTHVVAGRAGVRIRGALAWPSIFLPLSKIESADAISVVPLTWGGWGYRGSLRLFRSAAWIVRGGEGLRLNMRSNKAGVNVNFTVTVDDADAAAAVVNGLIDPIPRNPSRS